MDLNKNHTQLTVCLIISISFIVIFWFTRNTPEIFDGGKVLFDILLTFASGYIISYIFYFLNIYKPKKYEHKLLINNITIPIALLDIYINEIEDKLNVKNRISPEKMPDILKGIEKIGVVGIKEISMMTIGERLQTCDHKLIFHNFFMEAKYILESLSVIYRSLDISVYLEIMRILRKSNFAEKFTIAGYLYRFEDCRENINKLINELNNCPLFKKQYEKIFKELDSIRNT